MEMIMNDLSKLADFTIANRLIVGRPLSMSSKELTVYLESVARELVGQPVDARIDSVSFEEDQYEDVIKECQETLPSMYASLRSDGSIMPPYWPAVELACGGVERIGGMKPAERLEEIARLVLYYAVSARVFLTDANAVLLVAEALPKTYQDVPDYAGGRSKIDVPTVAAKSASKLREQVDHVNEFIDSYFSGTTLMEQRLEH